MELIKKEKIDNIFEIYYKDQLFIKTNIKSLSDITFTAMKHFIEISDTSIIGNMDDIAMIEFINVWIKRIIEIMKKNNMQGALFSWENNIISMNETDNKVDIKYDTSNEKISKLQQLSNEKYFEKLGKIIPY